MKDIIRVLTVGPVVAAKQLEDELEMDALATGTTIEVSWLAAKINWRHQQKLKELKKQLERRNRSR